MSRAQRRFLHYAVLGVFFSSAALGQATNVSKAKSPLFQPEENCARNYIYRNRTFPVDSSRKLDGEGLRPVLKKNPDAEAMLNDYQSSLRSSFWPAYVGSLGVAMAIAGPIYAGSLNSSEGQNDTRLAFLISGITLAAGAYIYGQLALDSKEKKLEKAVQTYNDAAPETEKIRVQISPIFSGSGGEIKTQVPF